MKSDMKKVNLTDELIREAIKLELESVDAPFSSEAWQRIEAELTQTRGASAKRTYAWSALVAVAAVFLILGIGGIGLFRSMQRGISTADSELQPTAGEEIAMFRVEDETADDSAIIMADSSDEITDELPVMIAEAEAEAESVSEIWPPLLAEDYYLFNTVILDAEDYPAFIGAFYRSSDAELLFVKDASPEMPVISFIDLLGIRVGVEIEVIEQFEGFIYFEALKMPGLAWQDENQNQALMVVSGSLDVSMLEEIASAYK